MNPSVTFLEEEISTHGKRYIIKASVPPNKEFIRILWNTQNDIQGVESFIISRNDPCKIALLLEPYTQATSIVGEFCKKVNYFLSQKDTKVKILMSEQKLREIEQSSPMVVHSNAHCAFDG